MVYASNHLVRSMMIDHTVYDDEVHDGGQLWLMMANNDQVLYIIE